MRALHTIVPMAGAGSRFVEAGYTTPKPLIPVEGRPMFTHALDGIDSVETSQSHTFIIRGDHARDHSLDDAVRAELPNCNVLVDEGPQRGALVAAYSARPFIEDSEGIFMTYCDVRTNSPGYFRMLSQSLMGEIDIDGALLLFRSDNPRFGYADLNEEGVIVATAEKKVISPYAIAAGHYVSDSDILDQAAQAVFKDAEYGKNPELYITDMYTKLIAMGGKVLGFVVEDSNEFVHFGTPAELTEYETKL